MDIIFIENFMKPKESTNVNLGEVLTSKVKLLKFLTHNQESGFVLATLTNLNSSETSDLVQKTFEGLREISAKKKEK